MSEDPFTPAELEAACKAVHELEDDTTDRYLSVKAEVAAALRAVLPLHAARVRAEERADAYQSAAHIVGDLGIGQPRAEAVVLREAYDLLMSEAAAIARAHRTLTGEDADHA